MYKVISAFADLQDGNHVYAIGDAYPREGYTPDEKRVLALSTGDNYQRKPLICEVKEAPKPRRKKSEE